MEPSGSEEGAVGGTGPPTDGMICDLTGSTNLDVNNNNNNNEQPARKPLESIQYNCGDRGPYRIYVELRNNEGNKTKINKFSLGASLRKIEASRGHIMDMKYLGRFKIMVLVNNFIKANMLVEAINAPNGDYRAYVPRHLVTITGKIAGIPADITEGEIQLGIQSEYPVVQVRRLCRWENNVQIPMNRVSVTFRASELPEKIKLFSCVTRILPFTRKVELCEKCLRYGHRTANCRGARRCARCGERHEEENEYNYCEKPVKCASCRTNHKSTDQECPERKKQENINTIRAKQNLTYAEARELYPVYSKNPFELLSNLQDYPSMPETFAATTERKTETLKQQWDRTNLPRQPIQPAVKMYKPDPKEKDKKKTSKRRLSVEDTEQRSNDQQQQRNNKEKTERRDGVGLDNPLRVTEKEKLESLIREVSQQTLEKANLGFNERIMKFYSMFIEQDLPMEIEEKFKAISKQCFDMTKTII